MQAFTHDELHYCATGHDPVLFVYNDDGDLECPDCGAVSEVEEDGDKRKPVKKNVVSAKDAAELKKKVPADPEPVAGQEN